MSESSGWDNGNAGRLQMSAPYACLILPKACCTSTYQAALGSH